MNEFDSKLTYYKSQHKTLGCKLTHMIGVPMIALSIPLFFISPRRGLRLFFAGWILQFIGHWVFEKNQPILVTENRGFIISLVALRYVSESWSRFLSGQPLIETSEEPPLLVDASGNGRGTGKTSK